jgi:hypothetical protein
MWLLGMSSTLVQTRLSRCPYPARGQWLSDSTQPLPCGLASLEPIFFLLLVARVICRAESHNMMKLKAQGNSSQSRKRVRRAGRPQHRLRTTSLSHRPFRHHGTWLPLDRSLYQARRSPLLGLEIPLAMETLITSPAMASTTLEEECI